MNKSAVVSMVVASVLLAGSAAFLSAGPLDPPAGPVAPSYKTLTEVEPRIVINSTNTPGDATSRFVILQPGSYYLTGNLVGVSGKNGIAVLAAGVTIDLNGFSLLGVPGSLDGISTNEISTTIKNGKISSWGGDGVDMIGNGSVIDGLSVDLCGGWGINLSTQFPSNMVKNCSVGQCTGGGINLSIASIADHCEVYYSNSAVGIAVPASGRVSSCAVWNCATGIQLLQQGATVTDCSTFQCATGISATGTDGRIERNTLRVSSGQVGLRATAAGNNFADNQVSGPGDCYNFVSGNRLKLLISQLPESIDWAASVSVTGALTGASGSAGLTINADDVTVDLNGNSLVGVPGSLDGIAVSGSRRNVAVRNGVLRSWGGDGVDVSASVSSLVEAVRASDNAGAGVRGGERCVVRSCQTRSNTSDNIVVGGFSQVYECVADASATGHGINASFVQSIVRDCTAIGNALSGIRASQRTKVLHCLASNNLLHGVHATFLGAVEDCTINANGTHGILVDAGGGIMIRNNSVSESSGPGDVGILLSSGGACQLEGNTVVGCSTGIQVISSANVIVRNSAIANSINFSIAGGNTAGPVVTSASAGTATNPLANYSN